MENIDRIIRSTTKKVTKAEIAIAVDSGYVVIHNIKWDAVGQKVSLPKSIAIPKEKLDADFNIEIDGADFISNIYEWCVISFDFSK